MTEQMIQVSLDDLRKSQDEINRLTARNAELMRALEGVNDYCDLCEGPENRKDVRHIRRIARAALDKGTYNPT